MAIINERKLTLGSYGVSTKGVTVAGTTKAYETIADRDADQNSGMFAFVKNAEADPTVKAGFAIYYKKSSGWKKVFEEEAMDQDISELVTIQWDNVVGRPVSTPAEIDAAVAKAHEHANQDVLDKISVLENYLKYDGQVVKANPSKFTKWLQLIRPISSEVNLHCKVRIYNDHTFTTLLNEISSENDPDLFYFYDGNRFISVSESNNGIGIPFNTSAGRFVIVNVEDIINESSLYIQWTWYEASPAANIVAKGVCVYPSITPTSTESVGLVDVNNTISWNENN